MPKTTVLGYRLANIAVTAVLALVLFLPSIGHAASFSDDSPLKAIQSRTQATLPVPPSRNRTVVSTDGNRLAVYEYGLNAAVAPTVVLVHGYPDNAQVWDQVVARLAPRYHVVTYDTRGSGNSSHPAGVMPYRLTQLSADLNAVLDATSRGRKVHLVGHDWGSVQSWESVAKTSFVNKIATYTSISGPSIDLTSYWLRRKAVDPLRWWNVVDQAVASSYIALFNLPLLPEIAWTTGLPEEFLRLVVLLEGGTREPSYQSGDGAAAVNLYRANVAARLLLPTYNRVAVQNVQIIVPVRDLYVKETTATDLGNAVSNPLIRRIDAGHWVPLSHPDSVASMISDYVNSHR